jgi:hypothetical protein
MNLYSNEFRVFVDNNKCTSVTYKNNTAMSHLWVLNRYYNPIKFKVGDTVYFSKYYKNDNTIFYSTENCKIILIEESFKEIKFLDYGIVKVPIIIYEIIDEKGYPAQITAAKSYNKTTRKIYNKAYNLKDKITDVNKLKEIWTFVSDFNTSMASLSKPYAITSHKAQGSTYDNVIIPIYDFESNYNPRDSNQLFYVAMSRAKSKIIFVNVDSNFSNDTNRVNFTQQERHMIALKTNFNCSTITGRKKDGTPIYCDHYFENVREFDVDHIKPLKDGGDNSIENLQILCKECHNKKTHERDI